MYLNKKADVFNQKRRCICLQRDEPSVLNALTTNHAAFFFVEIWIKWSGNIYIKLRVKGRGIIERKL